MYKNIYLDLDGVCCDFESHFLEYLDLPKHHPDSWGDKRFSDNLHRIAYNDNFWLSIPKLFDPLQFDLTAIKGYCTARHCHQYVIEDWLRLNNFPEVKVINVGLHGKKTESLLSVECDLFVDDAIHNFEELNSVGITTYLMSRPHNRTYNTDLRVENIVEFLQIVNSK
jgi:FMN phosphatase YigB (HAD superfamily)